MKKLLSLLLFIPFVCKSQGYDVDAQKLFDSTHITLSDSIKNLYNQAILSLKSSGDWNELDVFICGGTPSLQGKLLNWKKPSVPVIKLGTVKDLDYRGFYPDGLTGYLNLGNENSFSKYVLDNRSYGFFGIENYGDDDWYSMGVSTASEYIIPKLQASNNFRSRIGNGTNITSVSTTSVGLSSNVRLASNSAKTYKNGTLKTSSVTARTVTISSNPITVGKVGTFYSGTPFLFAYCGSKNISQTNIYNVMVYIKKGLDSIRPPINVIRRWISLGDSHTAGNGGTTFVPLTLVNTTYAYTNVQLAVSGKTSAQVISQQIPSVPAFNSSLTVEAATLWVGTNDLNTSVDTTTLKNNITSICSTLHAKSRYVIMLTILPKTSSSNPNFEAQRVKINTWLLYRAAVADTVINLTTVTQLQNPSNTTYFQTDGTHLTQAGDNIVGIKVRDILDSKN